eukprot:1180070-Prorocentrum_minimum.AAC.1
MSDNSCNVITYILVETAGARQLARRAHRLIVNVGTVRTGSWSCRRRRARVWPPPEAALPLNVLTYLRSTLVPYAPVAGHVADAEVARVPRLGHRIQRHRAPAADSVPPEPPHRSDA